MGFQFRKSIKVAPGVRLNLSKGGVSVSAGAPGSTVNVNSRGVRTTVGIPGTGLSYQTSRTRGCFGASVLFIVLLGLLAGVASAVVPH